MSLYQLWNQYARTSPGKGETPSGADPANFKFEDCGVMKRAEFYAAARDGVFDRRFGVKVYDRVDQSRMNQLFDELIAHSVNAPVALPGNRLVYPYFLLKRSKGAEWKQRYQVLKTGWMLSLQPSNQTAALIAKWRQEDGVHEELSDESAESDESESSDEEEEPAPPPALAEEIDRALLFATEVERAYDARRALRREGEWAGPGGYTFTCKRRKTGKSQGHLDFYARAPGVSKVIRAKGELRAVLAQPR